MSKKGTDKFDELSRTLAKELAADIPGEYRHKGRTYEIEGKVRTAAAEYFGSVFAGNERIDQEQKKVSVARDATDAKGLVKYFREVSKALGDKTDYSKSSDFEVLGHIKRTLNNSPYRAGKLVDGFLETGDPTVMDLLPEAIAGERKDQVKTEAEIKMNNAFRGEDGQVDEAYKMQMSTALAAMKMKAGLMTIKESPYMNVEAPGDGLESMVKGLRTDRGGGMYANTPWAGKAVNQVSQKQYSN